MDVSDELRPAANERERAVGQAPLRHRDVRQRQAREQFQATEIKADKAETNGWPYDGWPYFVNGWGRPIVWIRWAPGCSSNLPGGTAYYNTSTTALPAGTNLSGGFSDIQSGNYLTDHDPFDPRNLQADPSNLVNQAFRLIPLVLSAAGHTAINSLGATVDDYGVYSGISTTPTVNPFDDNSRDNGAAVALHASWDNNRLSGHPDPQPSYRDEVTCKGRMKAEG